MILDANVLIYASDTTSPFCVRARAWLEARLTGDQRLGLPWPTAVAYLRITTHPRVMARPFTPEEAWARLDTLLANERVWIPQPTPRHAEVLRRLVVGRQTTAALVPDAHLAALAVEHGVAVASADTDFARFPEITWVNPLA